MDFFRKQACPNGSRCELDHRTCASLSHLEAKMQQAKGSSLQRCVCLGALSPPVKQYFESVTHAYTTFTDAGLIITQ